MAVQVVSVQEQAITGHWAKATNDQNQLSTWRYHYGNIRSRESGTVQSRPPQCPTRSAAAQVLGNPSVGDVQLAKAGSAFDRSRIVKSEVSAAQHSSVSKKDERTDIYYSASGH